MMIEQALHDRLAIVERAFDTERMNIDGPSRGHHAPLHLGNAPVRKQHNQIDIREACEGVDRGAAGIARGRDHDGGALRALFEHMVHQSRDQLHRHVLERQGRAVKQFQQELMRTDLIQRDDGGMTEGGVGVVGHGAQIGVGNFAADKRADHVDRDFPIGPAEKSGDRLRRKLRPGLRHVKTAVAGKPGQHHVAEGQFRGLTPCGNILRHAALQRPFLQSSL